MRKPSVPQTDESGTNPMDHLFDTETWVALLLVFHRCLPELELQHLRCSV